MHHSQAVRHRALTSVCVGSNPTGVVCLTFIVDYHVLHFTGQSSFICSLGFVSVKGGARPLGEFCLVQRCEIQLIKVLPQYSPKILLHFPLIAVTGGICRYGIKVFQQLAKLSNRNVVRVRFAMSALTYDRGEPCRKRQKVRMKLYKVVAKAISNIAVPLHCYICRVYGLSRVLS